jgi:hypothetical protein
LLKTGFFRHVRELTIQRKNPVLYVFRRYLCSKYEYPCYKRGGNALNPKPFTTNEEGPLNEEGCLALFQHAQKARSMHGYFSVQCMRLQLNCYLPISLLLKKLGFYFICIFL